MAISDNSKKFFLAAFAIIVLDQIIKFLAAEGILGLPKISNTGIAFGFFQGNNLLLGVISAAVSVLVIFMIGRAGGSIEAAAMALILGGTLSNLMDRIFRGAVIDYISIKGIPTFNLADAALTGGAALIITLLIVQKFRK